MDLGTFGTVQLCTMLPRTVQGPPAKQLAAGWTPRLLATLPCIYLTVVENSEADARQLEDESTFVSKAFAIVGRADDKSLGKEPCDGSDVSIVTRQHIVVDLLRLTIDFTVTPSLRL